MLKNIHHYDTKRQVAKNIYGDKKRIHKTVYKRKIWGEPNIRYYLPENKVSVKFWSATMTY